MQDDIINTLCRRKSGLLVREIGGELLVLDTEADRIHKLNQTASLIWQNCDEAGSMAEIVQLIVDRFEVDPGVATTDVRAAICTLRALKLVVPGRSAGSAIEAARPGRDEP